jgi:cysteine desulfurase/selenocysteine lyase
MTHAVALPEGLRADFPIFASGDPPLAYLDNAATTQKPRAVLDALVNYYATANSNVGRGYYELSLRSTDCYERARATVQSALGAAQPEEIVFTRGTTDAINLLTDTLGRAVVHRDDQIVVSGMEHNSNLLPWRRLCETVGAELVVVDVSPAGHIELADFEAALGERVKLVALSHVSNVLGTVNPIRELTQAAHARGATVVVDGAQAVPHQPVDVQDLGADFYCFSGHKVYGPMGIGALYGRGDRLAELAPYQVGGGTVKGVTFGDPVAYVPAPARFEAGTPHVAGAVGLAAALDYVRDIGWDAIRAHHELLVGTMLEAVSDLERVQVIGDPGRDCGGIVSLAVDGIHPYDVGGHLDAHGIAVRCGVHCASTFLDRLGLLGTVRFSFAVYNTECEIARVRAALQTVRAGVWTNEYPTTRFL